jgi:hypothetical protein
MIRNSNDSNDFAPGSPTLPKVKTPLENKRDSIHMMNMNPGYQKFKNPRNFPNMPMERFNKFGDNEDLRVIYPKKDSLGTKKSRFTPLYSKKKRNNDSNKENSSFYSNFNENCYQDENPEKRSLYLSSTNSNWKKF